MKRALRLLGGACWSAAALAAQDGPSLDGRAFVELDVAARRVFVGQAVDVVLRVGLEERLWREQLVQLFRQRLDVAVRIDTPWARPIDGLAVRGAPPGFAGAATAVVDGAVVALRRGDDVERRGRRFLTFELGARLVPTATGTLTIPGAALQLTWAGSFGEDLFGDPLPRDRREARLEAGGIELAVEDLPAAGRPPGFTGLVGRFTARAELEGAPAARVGDGLALRFSVEGEGDLDPFVAPAPASLAGFHVRGVREAAEPGRRAVVYDLVALRADVAEVPPLAVPYFDPWSSRYRVAATEPIAVAISPAADGARAIDPGAAASRGAAAVSAGADPTAGEAETAAPVPGVDVLFGLLDVAPVEGGATADFAEPGAPSRAVLALGLVAPWLYALVLWRVRRRAGSREQRARSRRRRRAWRAFRGAVRHPGEDRTAALCRYLAAWLDCAPAAVVDPSLPSRLRAAGLDAELAAAVDRSLDRLAAARFGGEVEPGDAFLLGLVDRVDGRLRAEDRARRRPRSAGAAAMSCLLGALLLLGAAPPWSTRGDPRAAARAYAAGDAAKAFELYGAALEMGGFDPAALCFDLGNCAHALGRAAEAVLWYRRALRVAPGLLEARANLRLVQRQLGLADGDGRALGGLWLQGAVARAAAVDPAWLLWLAVVLQAAGWTGLLWWRRRGLAGVALAAGLVLAVALAWSGFESPADDAVVLRGGVRLQAEPHARAASVGALAAGEAIEVLEASPRWARVRRGGDVGWVESRAFERLALR